MDINPIVKVNCPKCDRELSLDWKRGFQVVYCDNGGCGCEEAFVAKMELTIKRTFGSATYKYWAQVYKIVPVLED